MRQAHTGQYGYGPYGASGMATAPSGGLNGGHDRLGTLQRAIDAIENHLGQPAAPHHQSAAPHQMGQNPQNPNWGYGAGAPNLAPNTQIPPNQMQFGATGPANNSEIGILQDQINRLSSQISAGPSIGNEQDIISAQISQRQQLLNRGMAAQTANGRMAAQPANGRMAAQPANGRMAAQPANGRMAAQAAHSQRNTASPVSGQPSAPSKSDVNMNALTQQLAGLKRELVAIKKQVAAPVAVKQTVSQAEIDKIAAAIGNLQRAPKPDETTFNRLAKELAALRGDMQKELGSTVKQEMSSVKQEMSSVKQNVADSIAAISTPNNSDELRQLADQIDALSQSVKVGTLQTVNTVTPRVENLSSQLDALRITIDDLPQSLAISRLEGQLSDMGSKIDELMMAEVPQPDLSSQAVDAIEGRLDEISRALVAVSNSSANVQQPDLSGLDRVEARLSELSREIDGLASRENSNDFGQIAERIDGLAERLGSFEQYAASGDLGAASALFATPQIGPIEEQLRGLETHLQGLTARVEEAAAQSQTEQLEHQIQQLAARMEEAAFSNSTATQISGLEAQIGQVLQQLNSTGQSVAVDFSPVESRLGEIENQLANSQNYSLEAAQQAAQQAVAMMGAHTVSGSPSGQVLEALSHDLRTLQMAAEDGNAQNAQTVSNVENTLNQIVERLTSIENTIDGADVTAAPIMQEAAHEVSEAVPSMREAHVMDEQEFEEVSAAPYNLTDSADFEAEAQAPISVETEFHSQEPQIDEPQFNEPQTGVIQQAAIEAGYSDPFEPPPHEFDGQGAHVDAPSLDPTEHIEREYDSSLENHALLEPGSDAPNLHQPNIPMNDFSGQEPEMDAPLSPQMGAPDMPDQQFSSDAPLDISSNPTFSQDFTPADNTMHGAPQGMPHGAEVRPPEEVRPDALAAARRALQATTAEMNAANEQAAANKSNKSGLAGKLENMKSGFDFNGMRKPLLMGTAALLLVLVAYKGWNMVTGGDDTKIAQKDPVIVEETVAQTKVEDKTVEASKNTELLTQEPIAPTQLEPRKIVDPNESEANGTTKMAAVESPANDTTNVAVDESLPKETNAMVSAEQTVDKQEIDSTTAAAVSPVAAADNVEPVKVAETAEFEVPASAGPIALVSAAKIGDPKALFHIGMRYSEGNDVKRNMTESAKWFGHAAEKGFAPAQYSVGSLYEKGIGVEQNYAKAAELYEQAAAQGNARAMHNLAVMYATENLEGVTTNLDKAVNWFKQAAEFGIKDSQFNLGVLYGQGMGAPQNLGESYKWFALAAKTGDTDAATKRDEVANAMDPDDLDVARKEVNNWAPKKLVEDANRVAVPKEWQGKGTAVKKAAFDGNTAVKMAQAALNQRGFNVGVPDGKMGPKTKRAIMDFQNSAGLKVTGAVDKSLIRALDIRT